MVIVYPERSEGGCFHRLSSLRSEQAS